MPLRADGRARAEWGLRALGLAAMLALAIRLWSGGAVAAGVSRVSAASLDSALRTWTVSPPAQAFLDATRLPNAPERDWLVALRRTGTPLHWTTRDSSGGALVVQPGPLPAMPSRITMLSGAGHDAVVSDALGRLDSARTGAQGVAEWRATPIGPARAELGASAATAAARESLVVRPIMVIGQAGWESKFVISALEEAGWAVAARLMVAPSALVRQGPASSIDTASFSAVVVLDSISALDGETMRRFVSAGGGVVASGAGVSHPALRALLPSRVAATSAGEIGGLLGTRPRNGLAARTFQASTNAVPLERRANAPVVVARRVGAGRIVVSGYDDTWRVRMTPPAETAPEEHRAWWSSLVASVAHARPIPRDVGPIDEAPLAATIDALGPPVNEGALPGSTPAIPWEAWLAALAAAALLGEWLSRRLRGVA